MRLLSSIILSFLILISFGFSFERARLDENPILWNSQNKLPLIKEKNQQIGLAGALIGVSNDRLIIAGGANFPAGLPWNGGKKVLNKDIYIAKLIDGGKLKWESKYTQLPEAIAYSANVNFENGFISIGGEKKQGPVNHVSYWVWNDKSGQLIEKRLPNLPLPLTNAAASIFNNRLYILGGENIDGPTNAVWFLDLAKKEKGWQSGPSLPLPTSHATAIVQADGEGMQLYLFGGRARKPSGISDLYNQVLRLSINDKSWSAKSSIMVDHVPIPAISAASGIAFDSNNILIFGGDDGKIFHQIETYDKEIKEVKSEQEKLDLISHKLPLVEDHPGFNKAVLLYNTLTDTWTHLNDLPYSPVTTTALQWKNHIIIPSGEIHPGIRTPHILIGTPRLASSPHTRKAPKTEAPSFTQSKIKVASIGNSVTYGAGIQDRENCAYPAQLQTLLGENFIVENFGRNGATLLKKGHNPYYKTDEFKNAIDYKGDIAIIHLGLNDTDPRNWPNYRNDFESDYSWLIDTLRSSSPKMEIYICKLTPIFSGHPRFLSSTFDWYWQIQSIIPSIANANGVQIIDLNFPLHNRPDLLPDNLHPNAEGARLLAETIFNSINGYSKGFKLDEYFGDHMVLQRNKPISIHGKANAGSEVVVSFIDPTKKGVSKSTIAEQNGHWELIFPKAKAGGPYEIEIRNDTVVHKVIDVLVGDVWLASGQSNMYFPLHQSENANKEIEKANTNTHVRLLKYKPLVETANSAWNETELDQINNLQYFNGKWKKSDPTSAAEFSTIAYYFAKNIQFEKNIPIGIIELAVGGSPLISWIDRYSIEENPLLANTFTDWRKSDYIQDWCRERANKNLENSTNPKQRHPYEPAYNFEAGISKLTKFPISGLLWYQGESDANNTELFKKVFPVFVESWRTQWKEDFPIYQVQLSSIDRPSWPYFRDAQRKMNDKIPSLYMVVSTDLGDKNDVHPIKKKEIGIRLANLALQHTYNKNIKAESPLPLTLKRKGRTIEITFKHGDGLKTSDNLPLRGFKVKNAKGHFIIPQLTTIKNNKVILTLSENQLDSDIHEVVYAWEGYTDANLINLSGLPASTFNLKIQ